MAQERPGEVYDIIRAAEVRDPYRYTRLTARERQERDEELLARLDRVRGGLERTNEWYRLTSARSRLTARMMNRAVRMARAAN